VRGHAEQRERLVDEVRAEVEEVAAGGAGRFFPAVGALQRAEAVVVAEHGDDAAKRSFGDQLAEGEKVAVVASVVERGEQLALRGGELDERAGVCRVGCQRLVDDDVLACVESCGGELDVRAVGGADHDKVDAGVVEDRGKLWDDGGLRVDSVGGGGAVRVGDDDGREFEPRHGGDERAVEDAAGQAIADDSSADGGGFSDRGHGE
jgi:hypothetical protein